ncbi:3-hydroxyacyl-CoA dehydrogenase [Nakamurella sp. DB0629]|uniref:3-hydroxyacyl-CoA dehydrogenase n=1 Tax=Nakamurella aerolata TaxID=1656892 RepID=A0A849AD19_9ACTN|nr:3-hydroxyacyl-CoA dehydrogenase NAD-binding domain-containing protein [Nakamurella aerolata]NNG37633.1 3-hydroxyacyl-CoA dehydrogenase [Nakamurella aerolata]
MVIPGEVVTNAITRLIDVPGVAGQVALITLDNGMDHNRPNTLGPAGLRSLDAALDQAFAAKPAAIAVTGKPYVFAAGADLSGIGALNGKDAARAIGQLGHKVFRRLHDSDIPTFAFINGVAFGGGIEIGLHCHYRTLAANAGPMALPECFLGILPGWGGTQLLPRLIGPENAVTVIVENPLNNNRTLRTKDAAALGVVDQVFDGADFLEQSLRWLADVVSGSVTVPRKEFSSDDYAAAVARGRFLAQQRTHGATTAPARALDLIEAAGGEFADDLTAGFAAEDEALADLITSEPFRAGLYTFNLTQKRARKPVGAPDKSLAQPVTKVGVVGAGLMASQLATLFVRRLKVPVVLTEIDQQRLDAGVARVHGEISTLAEKGRISPAEANRLTALVTGSLDYSAFADADLVIEAVYEQLEVKQQVFAELEKHVAPEAILATNTSSLSVTAMAKGLQHPERVVGLHFFNPVAVMPLLEIIRAEQTSDAAVATGVALAKQLRKSPIICADATGFVVNRLLLRFMGEILAAIDEGTDPQVADIALDPLGLPMTPIMLLQLVGPAVALHVQETLNASWPDRFPVSENLRRTVDSGLKQLVSWDADGTQKVSDEVRELWQGGDQPSTAEQVRERALAALATEARLMLDEGVVSDAADIDLGMITGAGWPAWLGGITPYLDREGISEKVTGKRFAPAGVATLPA